MKIINSIKNSKLLQIEILRVLALRIFHLYLKIRFGKMSSINIANNYPVLMDSIFIKSNWENWGSGHNNGFSELMKRSLNKDIIFDIGSHIGLCALPISIYSDVKRVYAFEPNLINRKYLLKHIEYNNINNIDVYDLVVGDRDLDDIEIYSPRYVSGLSSILDVNKVRRNKLSLIKSTHEQISIDSFCNKKNIFPSLIKIDVEGAEVRVLRGSKTILKNYKPEVILSIHPEHIRYLGDRIDEIFEICNEVNYGVYQPIDDGKLFRVTDISNLKLQEYLLLDLETNI